MHPTIPAVSAAAVPPDALLLDVREPHEWAAGHAPQALHVPMGRIPASLPELPRDREVVVVCHSGVRSAQVTAWLNEQGYACRNLTGGMVAYAATGGPLTSENGQPPVVD